MPSPLSISQRGGFQLTVVTAIVIVGFYLCFREIRRLGSDLAAVAAKLEEDPFDIDGTDGTPGIEPVGGQDGKHAGDKQPPGQAVGANANQLQHLLVNIIDPCLVASNANPAGAAKAGEPKAGEGLGGSSARITEIPDDPK